jgi:serine/threonine-protein kinase
VGRVAGRYELGPLLGSGGFASVYRARDAALARDIAIKITPFGDDSAGYFDRFRHEALALSRLKSRNIARVHDFGRDDAIGLYLVMEFIDGVPLDVRSLGRPLMPHEMLRVARGLMSALAEAHEADIVHRDIKPSNVLVPGGLSGLFDLRVLDFGIARSERRSQVQDALGNVDTHEGIVLGTPAYMAPEQIIEGLATPATDVYAAGLVLFELLDVGPLFPGTSLNDQLAGRLKDDPDLAGRVDDPLRALLERMLARNPDARFQNGAEALDAIGDLETAPVVLGELAHALRLEGPSTDRSTKQSQVSDDRSSKAPLPNMYGARRLSRLDPDGATALRDTLDALDLAMLDALARREASSELGTVARACVLTLRLELDAAAVLLDRIAQASPLARAVAATMIAPRARRATRHRIDVDRSDAWIEAIPPALAAVLVATGAALMTQQDTARASDRCQRALACLDDAPCNDELATTLKMARVTASSISGETPASSATDEFILLRDNARARWGSLAPAPLHVLLRGVLLGTLTFRADEHLAREQLERAAKQAADLGVTLFEARASVAWGGMLVEIPGRVEQGLGVLERAGTLLAHGDAPSLEHIAEHNRGAALIIEGRYAEAAPTLRRARVTASGELSEEHEALSCMNESFAYLALGDEAQSTSALEELTPEKLRKVSGRTATYVHVAKALHALLFRGLPDAQLELRAAHVRASQAEASGGDAYLLAEAIAIVCAVARGESVDLLARAGELEKLAQDRGFPSFYWFDVLRAVVAHIRDTKLRDVVTEALERLVLLLGPLSQVGIPA